MTEVELLTKVRRMMRCDSARIARFPNRMYLICGWNRDSKGKWVNQDGEPQRFDCLEEKCLASGRTLDALLAGIRHYRKLVRRDKIKDQ